MGIYTLTEQDVETANAQALAKFDEISKVMKDRATCCDMFAAIMDEYVKVLQKSESQAIKLRHYESV